MCIINIINNVYNVLMCINENSNVCNILLM